MTREPFHCRYCHAAGDSAIFEVVEVADDMTLVVMCKLCGIVQETEVESGFRPEDLPNRGDS